MPMYFWIQLYKAPAELAVPAIVQRTVNALVSAGCVYQFSEAVSAEDDSLPWEKQSVKWRHLGIDLGDAVRYATRDLESWLTTERKSKWLSGITLYFEFDFLFDAELVRRFDFETARQVKQVRLYFSVDEDQLFGEKIVIDLDTWEEYVLRYGDEETHAYNMEKILSIVEAVCVQITPHYGWLDYEDNPYDEQYDFTNPDKWHVRNEFAILGPQLIDKVPRRNLNIVSVLESGCVLLQS